MDDGRTYDTSQIWHNLVHELQTDAASTQQCAGGKGDAGASAAYFYDGSMSRCSHNYAAHAFT